MLICLSFLFPWFGTLLIIIHHQKSHYENWYFSVLILNLNFICFSFGYNFSTDSPCPIWIPGQHLGSAHVSVYGSWICGTHSQHSKTQDIKS